MKKVEFVNYIAKKCDFSKKQSDEVVKNFLDSIVEILASGDEVSIPGFGTFKTRIRPARTALHPQTRKELFVPEARVATFKAGKLFKDAIALPKADVVEVKAEMEEMAEV